MNEEIKSLTGIRGIAALWVVFLHYFKSLNLNEDLYVAKVFMNGFIAVDIFFLLSAFVMCLAYSEEFKKRIPTNSYLTFIKKRFARIYPAYFFWIFTFLLAFDFIKFNFEYAKIIVNLLLIQNFFTNSVIYGIFWSLSSEWILYLVFPFLYYVLQKNGNNYIKMFLILACVVSLYILPSMNNYFIDFHKGVHIVPPSDFIGGVFTGVNSILRCFFSYVIGINMFLLIKGYNVVNYTLVSFLKYGSLIGIFVIACWGKSAETYVLTLMCSTLLITALYLDRENIDPFFASKTVYFLGQISYSIYLCHMFIFISTSILVVKFFSLQIDTTIQTFLIVGSLVLLIPISYLSYTFIEIRTGLWLKSKLFAKHHSSRKFGFS